LQSSYELTFEVIETVVRTYSTVVEDVECEDEAIREFRNNPSMFSWDWVCDETIEATWPEVLETKDIYEDL